MKRYFYLFFFSFLNTTFVNARTFYVSVTGTETATGSIAAPLDISSVVTGKVKIMPGDTVLLRRGVYRGSYEFNLTGAIDRPIIFRSCPGEKAVLMGNIKLHPGCCYVTFLDFEITGDFTKSTKRVSCEKGSIVDDLNNLEGITVGNNINFGIKIINLVIHDVSGDGMGAWAKAINAFIYGNIIYNNGWDGPDRGHGHGIYTQNDTGIKTLAENICFWNLGTCGIKIYTQQGKIRNYYIEGNIHFNLDFFLIGGYKPLENITLLNNYMGEGSKINLGYGSLLPNMNLVARDNYLQNVIIKDWKNIYFKNNKIFGGLEIHTKEIIIDTGYKIDSNTYYSEPKIEYFEEKCDLSLFNKHGFDVNGKFYSTLPTKEEVFVRPNKYETGRCHVIIYNWNKADKIAVDLSKVLKIGDKYEIRDVQHFSGEPVIKNIYDGKPVIIPMNLTAIDTMIGDFTGYYHPKVIERVHTSQAFGVYLVRKTERND